MNRIRIKIVGESGSGLLSTGLILTNSLKRLGFHIVTDREYPSIIKGGYACFTINASTEKIHAQFRQSDLMIALDRQGLEQHHDQLVDGGILIHGYTRKGLNKVFESLEARNCKIESIDAPAIAEKHGGTRLMTNVILLGVLWKSIGLPLEIMEAQVTEKFKSKPKLLEIDLKCLKEGFESAQAHLPFDAPKEIKERYLINGNRALALGAIHAGCRAYYAYPMSPASSVLTYMANLATKTDVLVKQVEDEIMAAQMTIGSMFMGTRAMTATSGGGFDLMAESISLVGITEVPFVAVVVQRPGPATGLPTWTSQGDLNMVIHSGHGEFARLVIGVSDPNDAFELIQHAFNYAETFQIPVIVLSEKQIAESNLTIEDLPEGTIPIERGLVTPEELADLKNADRYALTENGVSKRWIPGSHPDAYYCANGDEHNPEGEVDEGEENANQMATKRLRKIKALKEALPEPEVIGEMDADIAFIGWGSSKGIMQDTIKEAAKKGIKVAYLHFSYVFPLKTEVLNQFFEQNKNVHLIEGNMQGQLGDLIEGQTGRKFKGRFLKFSGRAFFLEETMNYIQENKS